MSDESDDLEKILIFPILDQSDVYNATWLENARFSARVRMGSTLNKLKVPGFIKSMKMTDHITGQLVRVRVGSINTTFQVGRQHYNFDRLSGKLVGIGTDLIGPHV